MSHSNNAHSRAGSASRPPPSWLLKLFVEASAGAAGQLIATVLLHPIDTLKTRLQAAASTQTPKKSNSSQEAIDSSIQLKSSSKVGNTESSEWHGEFSGKFQNNAQSEIERKLRIISQVCSLYRGLAHKAVLSLISSFIFFYGYEVYKHLLKKNHVKLTPSMNVLVASLAGANNVMLTQPLDTYVTRIQTTEPSELESKKPPLGNIEKIKNEESDDGIGICQVKRENLFKGCYNGLGASLILCVNPGIQYAIFEQLKRVVIRRNNRRNLLERKKPNQSLSAFSAFVLGALSKSLSTFITYPLIRAKVVQQVHSNKQSNTKHRESLLEIMERIFQDEGVRGLYKGLQAQILKTVLGAAIALMLKEKLSEMQLKVLREIARRERLSLTSK